MGRDIDVGCEHRLVAGGRPDDAAFSSSIIPYLNETFRLIVFLIATDIINRLRISIDEHKEIARTDHLTGIANRRAFFDLADLELHKARRYETPISVLYLDIDNFKHINDHFGHHIGDRVLRSVARTIKNEIRAIDVTPPALAGMNLVSCYLKPVQNQRHWSPEKLRQN